MVYNYTTFLDTANPNTYPLHHSALVGTSIASTALEILLGLKPGLSFKKEDR